jgi:eukaryotic-like serine/threonine-protein kinase
MPGNLLQRWASLSPLLDELLDLDAAGRAARLAQCRATDPRLAQDLAELLSKQPALDAEAFLEGAVMPPPPSLAGQRVGAYTLALPIGAGGMGSVWRAHRSDGRFEGDVAVKLLNLALVAKGGAERFAREGQLLARLSHPNIAHLIDAGVTEGGQPYIVLEHVQGQPIDLYADTQALNIEARVRLLLQVLAAVEHAHGRLVLHRDLKPGNILVTTEGQIKLLDFGIAKLLDDESAAAAPTALTQAAGRAFTPEFAAPEQVQGGEVTTATDVYALGVLMYVLLAGAHPTSKPTDTPVDRLRSVVETEPQRLSAVAPARTTATPRKERARIAEALRGDLDNIAAKALKKLPAERYASVAAFADDLRRYLADEPVSARADSWRYRAAKFVRRHRVGVAAASFMLLSLVAGIVGTTWQAIEARRERDEALFQGARASARGNLMDLALQATGNADHPITRREILDRSVALIDKRFTDDPRIAVDLLYPIAGQYAGLGDSAKDLAVMRRAAEIAAVSGDAQLIAHVACNTVDAELTAGHADAARQAYQRAQAALAQVPRPGALTSEECQRAGAELARAEGRLDDAAERLDVAITQMERSRRDGGGAYATMLSLLANVHQERGDLRASFDARQKLHRLDARLGRTDSLNHLRSRGSEAQLLMALGEVAAAREIVQQIAQHFGGAGEPAPIWLERVQGELLLRLGERPRAETLLRSAADRARATGSVVYALPAEIALLRLLIESGHTDEAPALLARLQTPQARQEGSTRGERGLVLAGLQTELRLARGERGAARELEAALQADARPSPARAIALRIAARAALAEGNVAHALPLARESVVVAERVARDPAHSAEVGESLLWLARAEQAGGGASADTARRAAEALRSGLGPTHPLTREAFALAPPP